MRSAVRRELTLVNKLGLHARAAAKFVKLAGGFAAKIKVRRTDQEVDGKSIMGIMMLAAAKGSVIEVEAHGEDAAAAVDALAELVESRFGEPE